jgi:hypothetical protein
MTNNQSNKDSLSSRDESLYAELDTHSKLLRQSAVEMAEYLEGFQHMPREITLLIASLNAIEYVNIKEMDEAIRSLEKQIHSLNQKKNSTHILKIFKQDEISIVMEKLSYVMNESMELVKKATALNERV